MHIKEGEGLQINHCNFHLKILEKEEQMKDQVRGGNAIINIKKEIRKTKEKEKTTK